MWRAAEGDRTQYSDPLVGWTIRHSISGWSKSFSSTPKGPEQLWGPSTFLFKRYRGFLTPRRDADRSLHLVPSLRISGLIPLLPPICFMASAGTLYNFLRHLMLSVSDLIFSIYSSDCCPVHCPGRFLPKEAWNGHFTVLAFSYPTLRTRVTPTRQNRNP